MMKRALQLTLTAALLATLPGCGSLQPIHSASIPLESLLVPVKDSVRAQAKKPLTLPAKVLILALPDRNAYGSIPETTLQRQMQTLREQLLKDSRYVKSVTIAAPEDIREKTTLNRLADLYDADIVLILSCHQDQTRNENGLAALLDITILPAFIAPTVQVETTTLINAKIVHVSSNAIIFLASGEDQRAQRYTPYMAMEQGPSAARIDSYAGALDKLDEDIKHKLDLFEHLDLARTTSLDADLAEATAGSGQGGTNWQRVDSYKQSSGGGSADIELILALAAMMACRVTNQRKVSRKARA